MQRFTTLRSEAYMDPTKTLVIQIKPRVSREIYLPPRSRPLMPFSVLQAVRELLSSNLSAVWPDEAGISNFNHSAHTPQFLAQVPNFSAFPGCIDRSRVWIWEQRDWNRADEISNLKSLSWSHSTIPWIGSKIPTIFFDHLQIRCW